MEPSNKSMYTYVVSIKTLVITVIFGKSWRVVTKKSEIRSTFQVYSIATKYTFIPSNSTMSFEHWNNKYSLFKHFCSGIPCSFSWVIRTATNYLPVHMASVIITTLPSSWCVITNHRHPDCLLYRLVRRRSRKYKSSASLFFARGIHKLPVNSPHKGPVTRKSFHVMTLSCHSHHS